MSTRATKAELIGKIKELERQIGDYEHHIATNDERAARAEKERDDAKAECAVFKVEIASVRANQDKIGADLAAVKKDVEAKATEHKRVESERKRERLLAKVVKKERDLYRSILRAIAWELDQPGMKDKNPWSMSWAPLLYYGALAAPIWYMLKAGEKSRKTGEDVAQQGAQEAAAKAMQQKATEDALASVFIGKGP